MCESADAVRALAISRRARHRAYRIAPAPPPSPTETRGLPHPPLRNPHPRRWESPLPEYPRPVPPADELGVSFPQPSCCSPAIVRRLAASCRKYRLGRSWQVHYAVKLVIWQIYNIGSMDKYMLSYQSG